MSRKRWAIDLRPLATPSYRRMWIGTAFSNYGYQFTAVAVPVEMFALTRDSFWVGLLGVAALVPLLVFGLWGVPWPTRWTAAACWSSAPW